jgi:hypothetical protein
MALGSTQSLTEVSTKNLPGGKEWKARKADLRAIFYFFLFLANLQSTLQIEQ